MQFVTLQVYKNTRLMKFISRVLLCAGEDLNLHDLRHMALNHACLPIPAPAQKQGVL